MSAARIGGYVSFCFEMPYHSSSKLDKTLQNRRRSAIFFTYCKITPKNKTLREQSGQSREGKIGPSCPLG